MGDQQEDIARRTSNPASSSGTVVGSSAGDAEAKATQRVKKWAPKVRTGCLTCRARHVKCDEGKPECYRCVSSRRPCKGYQELSARPSRHGTQGARRRARRGAGPSRSHGDQDGPGPGPDDSTANPGEAEAPYSFDRSLSASSSMNQGRERESSSETHSTDQNLSDLLGGLKVNEQGVAPYLQRKSVGDEPSVVDEEEDSANDDDETEYLNLVLPMTKLPGHKLQIPPELMPQDSTVLRYFRLYFENVHPYVPVLDKVAFYRQWNTHRASISPMILEVIFAIGSRLDAESTRVSNQWLALASKHADDFMDVPRLTTLQALLILIKAREIAPKRGYFYRSWMMISQCVRMGKDLGLDEHYENHQSEDSDMCNLSPAECRLHTRLWQVVFVVEAMIGNPQGRHDLCVKVESVNFNEPPPISGSPSVGDGDQSEYFVSRAFTYMASLVRNVRILNGIYLRLRKGKNWGTQPEYLAFEPSMTSFLSSLPADLLVEYPGDKTSLPWLPSAFLGNLHSYYHLSILLFHRGVLGFLDPVLNRALWKRHIMICYNSARYLCRLQEAVRKQFGMVGLQSMQRGYSFTVYAGLSCIVIHLVAIVSPDPDLNTGARENFERCMRLMEEVMQAWWMPDLQKQIDAFRRAFSADLSKPFVLRPDFPNIRPRQSPPNQPEKPPPEIKPEPNDSVSHPYTQATARQQAEPALLDTPQHDLATSVATHLEAPNLQIPSSPATHSNWNSDRIFQNWNSLFGPPPQLEPFLGTAVASQTPLPAMDNYTFANVSAGPADGFSLPDMQALGTSPQVPNYEKSPQVGFQPEMAPQYTANAMQGLFPPSMWQSLAAAMYEEGQTRPL
ncbi:uncharacterized protein MAM_01469 [Metarhizium album ARSEF 1941]|uniref:Transcription factor, fungi n=1 Tax=Metarhizium album (strain ARSEF 1941) TaxID=1081103 RepID=A0A0B2X5V5_METAS|nr:uncharacterized protein MAM_01469 [Metarhizium album ARSEF 1941]KHO00691.1 Transcription factor, fungi [Metarhizium album ARSEF 1941]